MAIIKLKRILSMSPSLPFFSILLYIMVIIPCEGQDKFSKLPPYHIAAAPEWTNQFKRTQGWFGADGIFSISLNGLENKLAKKSDVWFHFSDTFIGTVKNNVPDSGYIMVNNTLGTWKNKGTYPAPVSFLIATDSLNKPISRFFPPKKLVEKGEYFWLGDGFVNRSMKDSTYIFAYHIRKTGPNVFDFEDINVSILAIAPNELNASRIINTPLHIVHPLWGPVNLGAGIFVNTSWAGAKNPDGFVYVYGCLDKDKKLVAARIKPKDFTRFESWQYWDGSEWQSDPLKLAAITNHVSNELSLTQLKDGRYLLVFQVLGLSDKVGARIGQSPIGPFSDIIELYQTPESKSGLFTYNAKAHPVLSRPGELLISYNTITFDFWNDIKKDATIYYPRFFKIIWDK